MIRFLFKFTVFWLSFSVISTIGYKNTATASEAKDSVDDTPQPTTQYSVVQRRLPNAERCEGARTRVAEAFRAKTGSSLVNSRCLNDHLVLEYDADKPTVGLYAFAPDAQQTEVAPAYEEQFSTTRVRVKTISTTGELVLEQGSDDYTIIVPRGSYALPDSEEECESTFGSISPLAIVRGIVVNAAPVPSLPGTPLRWSSNQGDYFFMCQPMGKGWGPFVVDMKSP